MVVRIEQLEDLINIFEYSTLLWEKMDSEMKTTFINGFLLSSIIINIANIDDIFYIKPSASQPILFILAAIIVSM